MNHKTILSLYERLEGLVSKLPAPLQKPLLHEMTPVKNLFLRQRSPRICIAGEPGPSKADLINTLFQSTILSDVTETHGWHEFSSSRRSGAIRLLDARLPASEEEIKRFIEDETPDLFLFLRSGLGEEGPLAEDIRHFNAILESMEKVTPRRAAVIGVLMRSPADSDNVENSREQLNASLHTKRAISERLVKTVAVTAPVRFRLDGSADTGSIEHIGIARLAQLIAEELPEEARLEMARLCGVREVQVRIAQTLIKAFTAICAAIGTQPIPLADFPILTALQVMMISGIMHISGREVTVRLAGEFIAALGANVGIGLVFREGSRALLKFLPGWGNAISGAIAGGGTYALGRAASAYFIEGVSIKAARNIFQRKREALHN